MAYKIFSDSSCDLPQALLDQHQIGLIPFYVSFDQETYFKENIELSNDEFYYSLMNKNLFPKTSLPSVQDYINKFRPALEEGFDIACLCITHKFSGSYQSAMNAKSILEEKYPSSNIYIIDSIQATGGQGLLLLQMAYMKAAGLTIEENVAKLEQIKSTARIMFTVDTLEYLAKGRRIGKVKSLASEFLNLKPLIQLKEEELIPYSNVRGRKKSLEKILFMVEEYVQKSGERYEDYDYGIANATTMEDAQYLKKQLEILTGQKINYPMFQIGVTIGTYTGPGAIGVCLVKKYNHVS